MRISDWSSDVCSSDLDTRTPWAHAVLAEQGYAYSSSVAPVVHDHYGWPQSPRHAWRPVAGSDLVEWPVTTRSEEHTSELQSLMRISYAVFCLKKNKYRLQHTNKKQHEHIHLNKEQK